MHEFTQQYAAMAYQESAILLLVNVAIYFSCKVSTIANHQRHLIIDMAYIDPFRQYNRTATTTLIINHELMIFFPISPHISMVLFYCTIYIEN